MNIWDAIITEKGIALMTKLVQGTSLNLTRAEIGSGYVSPGMLQKQIAVTDPKNTIEFRPVSYPEEGKVNVPVTMTNDAVTTGYTAMQVGCYALDPDDGEILYFIAQANAGTGVVIPSAKEMPGFSAEWTFTLQYGQADNVTVSVDPAGTVSRSEMETYVKGEFESITPDEIDSVLAGL